MNTIQEFLSKTCNSVASKVISSYSHIRDTFSSPDHFEYDYDFDFEFEISQLVNAVRKLLVSGFSQSKLPGGVYLEISDFFSKMHLKLPNRNLIASHDNYQKLSPNAKDIAHTNEDLITLTNVSDIRSSGLLKKAFENPAANDIKSVMNIAVPSLSESNAVNARLLNETENEKLVKNTPNLIEKTEQTGENSLKLQANHEHRLLSNNSSLQNTNQSNSEHKQKEICDPNIIWKLACELDDSYVFLDSPNIIDHNMIQQNLGNFEESIQPGFPNDRFKIELKDLNKSDIFSAADKHIDLSRNYPRFSQLPLLARISSGKNSFELDGTNCFAVFMFLCFSFLFARCFAQFCSRFPSNLRKFRNIYGRAISPEQCEAISESELNVSQNSYEENMELLDRVQQIIPTCDREKLLEIRSKLEEKGLKADPSEIKKIEDEHTLKQIESFIDYIKENDVHIFVRNLKRLSNEVLEFRNSFNYNRKKIDKLLDDIPEANQHWQKDQNIVLAETKELIEDKVLEISKRDYFFTDKVNNIFETKFAQESDASCRKYLDMNKEAYKEYVLETPTFYSKVKFDETSNSVKYFKKDVFEDDLSNCLSRLFEEEDQPII